jgi:peptidoglycan-associated lipoprotein
MKTFVKNTLLGVCAVGILAGCASKDVTYEDSGASSANGVNNKLDNISGYENNVANSNANANDTATQKFGLNTITNNGVNQVESEIGNKTVLLESVHFNFDKFNLTDDMRSVATSNYSKIDVVSQQYPNVKVKLEGNCDEWGTDEYNYALGLKRAKATKEALVADGMDASKIMLVSFGESNPVCNQKTSACWKMNRRVDYRLLP